jgi:hypothetical protein
MGLVDEYFTRMAKLADAGDTKPSLMLERWPGASRPPL